MDKQLREKITPENMNELTHIAMGNPPEDSYNNFTYNCYLERTKKVVDRTIALIEPLIEEAKQNYDYLIRVKVRQAVRQTTKMFVSDRVGAEGAHR